MEKIQFWEDKENRKIDPSLFSTKAEALAQEMAAAGNRLNKRSQIRKFYDEVVKFDMQAKMPGTEWDNILPLVNMLTAKAAYAKGRRLVSDDFLAFIKNSVEQIKVKEDLSVFANLFEAFYGFYRIHRND